MPCFTGVKFLMCKAEFPLLIKFGEMGRCVDGRFLEKEDVAPQSRHAAAGAGCVREDTSIQAEG